MGMNKEKGCACTQSIAVEGQTQPESKLLELYCPLQQAEKCSPVFPFVDGGAYTPQLLPWCVEIKGKVMKTPVWWHLGRGPKGTAGVGGWVKRESCS